MTGQPPQDRSWDDLLGTGPERSQAEIIEDTRHLLGLDARRVRNGDRPDVSGLAEELGLGRPE